MSKVDLEKFPAQQALTKVKARADGNCYTGICAVSQGPHGVVALIAPDIETLRIAWDDISGVPLDEDGCQRVAIFSHDAVTPNVKLTSRPAVGRSG